MKVTLWICSLFSLLVMFLTESFLVSAFLTLLLFGILRVLAKIVVMASL